MSNDEVSGVAWRYNASRNVQFDLDKFINQVCQRFETSYDINIAMILIDWIDQLHSSPSVNIIRCMPRFVPKFLSVIELQEGNHVIDLGKKALAQLNHFLEDLKDPRYRSL